MACMRVRLTMPTRRATGRGVYTRVTLWPEDSPLRVVFAFAVMQHDHGRREHVLAEVWVQQDTDDPHDLEQLDDIPQVTGPVIRDLADRFAHFERIARSVLAEAIPETDRVVGTRKRRGLTDEFLSTIAGRYRGHRERGASPVLALAREEGVSRRTASNWVQKAREAGHLALPGEKS